MSALKYFACIVLLMFQPISAQNFWHTINGSFGDVEVTDLCLTKNEILFAYVEWSGLYYTTNNGELWIETNYQGYEPNAIETINDSIIIIGQNDFVTVSYDTGKTWQVTGNFDVESLYYDSVQQIIYLGSKRSTYPICGIYTSSDYGQSWSLLYEFPHINSAQWITKVYVTRNNHTILASQIATSPIGGICHLYQSTDNGITWQVIYQDYNRAVTSILQDVNSTLYALGYEKLMISEDEGQTWITRISAGRTVLVSDYSGRIYKDNGIGILYSTDKGITWIPVDNSGLNNWVNDIVINQNNSIFLATTGGMYVGEADSIVLSSEKFEPVKTFYLSQNYPNPFNPSTKIKYEIPDQVRNNNRLVTLKVYDVLGNKIATLVNEEKQPGIYEVEFNTSSIKHLPSSGIYFYQLKADNYIQTKKMVLLK